MKGEVSGRWKRYLSNNNMSMMTLDPSLSELVMICPSHLVSSHVNTGMSCCFVKV